MTKINQEEYEVLKELDDKWKWIARDGECSSLNVFSVKPIKVHTQWDYMDVGYKHVGLTKEENKMFQFIQWEDEESYNIAELIEEYEDEEYGYFNMKLSREFEQFNEESEETEVKKDIEWVKEQMNRPIYGGEHFILGYGKAVEKFNGLIDQLNEPETLSQEWIDGKKLRVRNRIPFHMDVEYAVPEEDLRKALVPKQEEITEEQVAEHLRKRNMTAVDSALVYREKLDNKIVIEKPTIPQFVADFIESYDGDFYTLLHEADIISSDATLVTEEYYELGNWLSVNSDELLQAVANGYEVAEEPKYRVEDSHGRTLLAKMEYSDKGKRFEKVEPYNELIVGYKKELTEQEIKDYDSKYWTFRKPVEEME